jgi:hypothetical protein
MRRGLTVLPLFDTINKQKRGDFMTTMDKIQENLRDATNEAESMMWRQIKQMNTQVYDSKNEQVDDLKSLAKLITLYTTSREALGKTFNYGDA